MSTYKYFVERWKQEQPAFAKVLKAMPAERLDYRPHERSSAAGDLAWQLVIEQKMMGRITEGGEFPWDSAEKPGSHEELVAAWERYTAELEKKLEQLDDAKAGESATMKMGESGWTESIHDMLWGFLFDMVHHRGQLSTYLRPMGGKVPSIYGPSADDSGQ